MLQPRSRRRPRTAGRLRVRRRIAVAALGLWAAATPLGAQEASAPPSADAARWVELLRTGDALAAAEAEEALTREGWRVRPLVEQVLLESERSGAQRRALRVLAQLGDRRASTAIRRLLFGERPLREQVRLEAADALLRLGDKGGIEVLIELMQSGERGIRLGAHVVFVRHTHRDFGFRFDAPGGERAAALARLRRWWQQARADFEPVAG